MKYRTSIAVMLVPIVLAGVSWMVTRGQGTTVQIVTAGVPLSSVRTELVPSQSTQGGPFVAGQVSAAEIPREAQPEPRTQREPAGKVEPVASKEVASEVAESPAELKYVAATGDTVSNMAAAFRGSDPKVGMDAIIRANASLQANPDRVVPGKAYRIPAPDGLSASAEASRAEPSSRPVTQPDADELVTSATPRTLRYTARTGDTVTSMAVALLGRDSAEARDAILNNNPSLKRHPDRVIAGQTYWIPAPAIPASR